MPRKSMSPSQLAAEASHRIQDLNRRTIEAGAYPYPGDVDDVVQSLKTLAGFLPQAISQGSSALAQLHASHSVRLDNMGCSGPLDEHMKETLSAAADAVQAAAELENALGRLGARTTHLAFAEPTGGSQ